MSICSQSLGLGSREELKLRNLLNNASPRRHGELEEAMQKAVADAIQEPDLTAANIKSKVAAQLRIQIPELTRP